MFISTNTNALFCLESVVKVSWKDDTNSILRVLLLFLSECSLNETLGKNFIRWFPLGSFDYNLFYIWLMPQIYWLLLGRSSLFLKCDETLKTYHMIIRQKEASILPIIIFLLRFYISQIMRRYWGQMQAIPKVSVMLAHYLMVFIDSFHPQRLILSAFSWWAWCGASIGLMICSLNQSQGSGRQ